MALGGSSIRTGRRDSFHRGGDCLWKGWVHGGAARSEEATGKGRDWTWCVF